MATIPTVDESNTGQAWYTSKGVLGSLVTVGVSILAARLSYKNIYINETDQAKLIELIFNIIAIIAGAVAWYGRVFATRKISKQVNIPVVRPPTPVKLA